MFHLRASTGGAGTFMNNYIHWQMCKLTLLGEGGTNM